MTKGLAIFITSVLLMTLCVTTFGQKNRSSLENLQQKTITTKYESTEAFTDGQGVYVTWQMEAEYKNLGFNVFRIDGDKKVRVNPYLIGGGFSKNGKDNNFGFKYSFFDPTGSFGATYIVESFDFAGNSISSNYFLTRFVRDLTPIAGLSSEVMTKAASEKNNLTEKVEPILPKALQSEINRNSLQPDVDRQKFIAAQPGVKISVKREGIYRVTSAELGNAGFDLNQPSSNWQLYVNGIEQAIIIGENNSYIEFYGKGVDTLETDKQVYYLINGTTAGKRIKNTVIRRIGGTVVSPSYFTSALWKENVFYLKGIRNGGNSNFFSDKIINATGVSVNFNVNHIDFNESQSLITVRVQGLTLLPHNVEVRLNGTVLGNITGNNQNSLVRSFSIPTSLLVSGTNTLFLKQPNGSTSVCLLDSILVNYKKLYRTSQSSISLYTNAYRKSDLTGFTSSNIRVFDITYPDNASVVVNLPIIEENGTFGVELPANRSRKLFAAQDSAILTAASITPNIPSTLSTTNHNANFIIISYKDWLTEANTWANYRINEGFSSEVVNVEDIFDEFNFGRISANSIKDFLQYAKLNWQTPPDYVLLLGDTTYDPRDYENRGSPNFIPVIMVDTIYDETGSDEAMADFDNDGLAEIAIGRVSNRDPATVTLVYNKVVTFEQTVATGLSRGVLFVSDCPVGYDFVGLSQRLINELPNGTNTTTVNRCLPNGSADSNARPNLLNELNTGKFIVNYSGHGASGLWSSTGFYSILDVPNISNGNNLSIFTMLTCLNGYFLRTDASSLAEDLLYSSNGGGVVVWSSTSETTPDVQEIMARRFYQTLSETNVTRIGDSIKLAKQNVNGGRDVRLSWALLGDPLLKIK